MKTVFYRKERPGRAFINPTDTVAPVSGFPNICVSTYSRKIIEKFAALEGVEIISHLYTANGAIPIYKIPYGGSEIAFYMSPVGAPACVSCFEEAAAMGAEKFVFFGCCGILNDEAVKNRLIIPTGVIRDEGTSYHYLPPTEELQPDSHSTEVLKSCMEKYGFPYACGKIWTTDAIYRETPQEIAAWKEAGCIGVEMEYSALLAAAAYRNLPLIQFFYGADSRDNPTWQPRDLTDWGLSGAETYMTLAFACGLAM